MRKIIYLNEFVHLIKNKSFINEIQLEVEGKFFAQGNKLKIKWLIVPKKLLQELGIKQVIIDREGDVKINNKDKQPTLRESIVELKDMIVTVIKKVDNNSHELKSINKRLSNVELDIKAMKNTPTMKKELNI